MAKKTGIYGSQLNETTYMLTITSFNLSEEYAYYLLQNIFTEIKQKKLKKLILDIRDNAGGSLANIPLFYSFISQSKTFKNTYKYATKVPEIRVKNYLVDEDEKALNTNEIITLNNFMKQRFDKNEADGFYYGNNRLEEYYVEHYPQDKDAFEGEIVLIQNNNTISAAAYFASVFQANNRGVIVGQETGSCKNFTTAAWFLYYKLPNTGMLASIPRSEIFFNTQANDATSCRGVLPDYTLTGDQFQQGLHNTQDAELNLALSLLKE
ncbi:MULTISPECIES: S41 family peptidase [unclassified Myroides]|uniref:S41 family peptidase n=1 Tax=unclassified Myroides TaxID=2642485 RepID=UPI003D2F6960